MRARLERLGERYRLLGLALKVQERFGDVQGAVYAKALTLSLFLSVFPLLLVATAVVGFLAAGDSNLTNDVVEKLGLTGSAADSIGNAIEAAQKSRRTASVIGFLGLVLSALGIVSGMQIAIDRPWQSKGRGFKDTPKGLGWLVGAGLLLAASGYITGKVVGMGSLAASYAVLITAIMNVMLFWFTFGVLGSIKVGWKPLLPGAVAAGVGLQALTTIGAYYVPRAVASSSALYGAIGVVFAILGWLYVFGRLVVYAATLNVVLYERDKGTVTVDLEAPRVPGATPVEAQRSGVVVGAAAAK
ncbi:MAG: YihY/virulence factor BrkB family protein [Acidimicrobiia bacterium]